MTMVFQPRAVCVVLAFTSAVFWAEGYMVRVLVAKRTLHCASSGVSTTDLRPATLATLPHSLLERRVLG